MQPFQLQGLKLKSSTSRDCYLLKHKAWATSYLAVDLHDFQTEMAGMCAAPDQVPGSEIAFYGQLCLFDKTVSAG